MLPYKQIKTPRLLLRPFKRGDDKLLYPAVVETFPALHQWMEWAKTMPDLAQIKKFTSHARQCAKQKPLTELPLLAVDNTTNAVVGVISYTKITENPWLEIGYWIRQTMQNQGYATEAVKALTDVGFNYFKPTRIQITCDADNIASRKVAESAGYQLEAIIKNDRIKPETKKPADTALYALYSAE